MNSASASSRSRSFHRAAAPSRFAPMANSSIPNSTLATGRISMPSSERLRNLNERSHHSCSLVRRSKFGVRSSAYSFLSAVRRVKGAWWPSRSSKPLSIRYTPDRGRFDSYPLRFSIFNFLFPISYRLAMRGPEIQNPRSSIQHIPVAAALWAANPLCERR